MTEKYSWNPSLIQKLFITKQTAGSSALGPSDPFSNPLHPVKALWRLTIVDSVHVSVVSTWKLSREALAIEGKGSNEVGVVYSPGSLPIWMMWDSYTSDSISAKASYSLQKQELLSLNVWA